MRWIGLFNIAYGGLGMAAALYLGRTDAILLCAWVIASGMILRSSPVRRLSMSIRNRLSRLRGDVLILDESMVLERPSQS